MTTTAYQFVGVAVADGVGTLTLNRPDRLNAFDRTMCEELQRAARELVDDPAVRAIVVTGAGRAFSAGADLATLEDALRRDDVDQASALVLAGGELVRMLRQARQPVLASINGPAAGGGANLALACDVRIASDQASIGQVFHRIGLHPDWGGTFFLPRLVGASRALELLWSMEMVPAARCLELGLVNRVVPAADLARETAAWAARLAALPPLAAELAKQAIYHGERSDLATALEREAEHQLICFRSQDAREGLAAFGDKRHPVFHGR